jgi:arabinogalactan oligomer/maltooligosaccharide transport system substrate-binding protein
LEQRFAITDQIPPRKDIDTNKPLSNGIKAQLAYSKPMPTIPQLGTYWSAMGSAYSGIWDGDPVKPALDAAAAAMEAAK